MAIKKDVKRRPITSDPAVSVAMGSEGTTASTRGSTRMGEGIYEEMERARNMTPEERKRAARKAESEARRKAEQAKRDAKRNKVTFDLPEEITREIERLASQDPEFRVPASHIVAVLLHHALKDLDAGEIDLWSYRVRSNVPRFDYFLRVEPEGGEDA